MVTQQAQTGVEVRSEKLFTGPIPAPETLAGYRDVLPDAPDRILRMAEVEAAERQSRLRWETQGAVIRAQSGVVSAFLLCLIAIGSGAYLVMNGHDIAGTLFAGAGLTSLVGVFIYGTNQQNRETGKGSKK
jgi:uncharacterized membrane protein